MNLMNDMGWAGTIYRMVFYRAIMRIIHRFGWCKMDAQPIIDAGERQRYWCQWCGMRGTK